MTDQKLYIVLGSYNYEGDELLSVFNDYKLAENDKLRIEGVKHFDRISIIEVTINEPYKE